MRREKEEGRQKFKHEETKEQKDMPATKEQLTERAQLVRIHETNRNIPHPRQSKSGSAWRS